MVGDEVPGKPGGDLGGFAFFDGLEFAADFAGGVNGEANAEGAGFGSRDDFGFVGHMGRYRSKGGANVHVMRGTTELAGTLAPPKRA
jgi:hypothetical protein